MKKLLTIFSILSITTLPTMAANVSGTVLDENNQPFGYVAVAIPGTTTGTTTDADGKFELKNVPDNATLEIKYVGYKTQTVSPGTNLEIKMEADTITAEEVTVIGCSPDTKNGIKAKALIDGECYPSACVEPRWRLLGTDKNTKCVEQKCKIDNGTGEWTVDGDTWKCTLKTCKNGYDKNKDDTKCVAGELSESDSLAKIDELRDNADAMKAKEQSTANKLLGAAGIGATGIGGMQMASAMAEENADADAERAMRAYLATFHCNYGAGKNIAGGERDVELPGGNELISLYSEYVNLANDLKARKTALDMRPGIESESILDAATSGLYDDVAIGKTSGAYTSLARALMDPTGADATAWAAQKEETADKKKTGMITAGIGAAGSLVGNLATNSDKNKQNKVDEILAEYNSKQNKVDEILAEYDRQNTSKDGVNDETIINCIEEIMNTTFITTSENKIKISCAIPYPELTSQEALAISQNWDYDNLQLYSNTDSVVQEHEKDACETLKKLKKHIKDKNLCPGFF